MFGEKGGSTYENTTDLCGNEKKKEKAENDTENGMHICSQHFYAGI
jgi:hypothetical protein